MQNNEIENINSLLLGVVHHFTINSEILARLWSILSIVLASIIMDLVRTWIWYMVLGVVAIASYIPVMMEY